MQDRDPNGSAYRDDGGGEDEEGGFDLSIVRDYLSYVVRALRLHRLLAGGVVLTIVPLALAVILALPKTYHVESKVLAQREAGVGGSKNFGADPLKGSGEIIKGHENLTSLVKQLDLVTWSRDHQSIPQRIKNSVRKALGRVSTDEDLSKALVEMLEQKMEVWQGDTTLTLTLNWSEGVMAARIVDTAEQNFLEKRHVMEISTIAESVSILEEHAAKLRDEIEDLARRGRPAEEKDAAPKTAGGTAASATRPTASVAAASRRTTRKRPELDVDLVRQKVMIETKQRAISDLEEFRQRRLLDLQANLSEQRSKFTDAHPIVVGLQQNIEATSRESPQVATLRAEVKALQEDYDRAMRDDDAPKKGGGFLPAAGLGASSTPIDIDPLLLSPREDSDPAMEAQIQYAVRKYSEVRAQISTARIDLDLAQAAFRYRYTIVVPAEPPNAPMKPKVPLLIAAAVAAALGLGLLAAVAAELRSGRIVSRWQVERLLKLPVLGEPRLPMTTKPDDRS